LAIFTRPGAGRITFLIIKKNKLEFPDMSCPHMQQKWFSVCIFPLSHGCLKFTGFCTSIQKIYSNLIRIYTNEKIEHWIYCCCNYCHLRRTDNYGLQRFDRSQKQEFISCNSRNGFYNYRLDYIHQARKKQQAKLTDIRS